MILRKSNFLYSFCTSVSTTYRILFIMTVFIANCVSGKNSSSGKSGQVSLSVQSNLNSTTKTADLGLPTQWYQQGYPGAYNYAGEAKSGGGQNPWYNKRQHHQSFYPGVVGTGGILNRDSYSDAAANAGYGGAEDTSYQIPQAYPMSSAPYYGSSHSSYDDYDTSGGGGGDLGGLAGLAGLLGLTGLKGLKGLGLIGLLKFGLVFAPILAPILLPVLLVLGLPLLLLLALPILFLPIPVVTVPVPGRRAAKLIDDTETFSSRALRSVRDIVMDEDCVERISCEVSSRLAYSAKNSSGLARSMADLIDKILRNSVKTEKSKKSSALIMEKISQGIQDGFNVNSIRIVEKGVKDRVSDSGSVCSNHNCRWVGSLKKAMRVLETF